MWKNTMKIIVRCENVCTDRDRLSVKIMLKFSNKKVIHKWGSPVCFEISSQSKSVSNQGCWLILRNNYNAHNTCDPIPVKSKRIRSSENSHENCCQGAFLQQIYHGINCFPASKRDFPDLQKNVMELPPAIWNSLDWSLK